MDTNIFIDAKNRYYHPKVCPGFWDWLVQANGSDDVYSIERVYDELTEDSEDEVSEWAKQNSEDFFIPVDEEVLPALQSIAAWANAHSRYSDAAKADFLDSADYYLVAQALAGGHTVVTHERPAPSIQRVKIPDACIAQKVKCVNPWEMLRKEHARFVLEA
ncbi:MAG: DUF4411 family protein [Planctomycetota bacterium]